MNDKQYKTYLKKKDDFFIRTEGYKGKTRKAMRLKYYKPFLKKIGAIEKKNWLFQLNDWFIYPTTRLVMHRNRQQLKIDKFIESFLFPEKVSIEKISKDAGSCPFDIENKPKKDGFYEKAKSHLGEKTFLYCCGCKKEILATLVNGKNIYTQNKRLHKKLLFQCDCGLYVGTHRNNYEFIQPLGCIPTKELRSARQHIHKILDPIWQSGKSAKSKRGKRTMMYQYLKIELGYEYHTGEIKTIKEARRVYKTINEFINQGLVNVKRII